ncbi:fimbrin-like [Halichondria panicea]|uniref:fimbrin-like n=1 Tax=Halichondria panicea TaxID=6063 RepID=UPI00312B57F9
MAAELNLETIRESFDQFDADKNGHITASEIGAVLKALGEDIPGYKVRDMIKEVDIDENGTVEFAEFIEMYKKVKAGKTKFALHKTTEEAKKLVTVGGLSEASAEGTQHSFSEEESIAFVDWINYQLEQDPDVASHLPVAEEGEALFAAVHDGIILCKLINTSVANTVDERAINKTKLNVFRIQENQTLALNSASSIGCNIINIGPQDIMEGRPHLILGLLWQVIKIGLFAKISLQNCPNLAVLLQDGEDLSDLLALSPEEILLRWFNYHLEQAGSSRRVRNFGKDINDSECYTILLNQIAPEDSGVDMSPMNESDPDKRAEQMLNQANKIGCRKFVRPKDVVKGNQRLNLAFVAHLFNTFPALKAPEDGLPDFDLGDYGETREEKTFRNWMNSMGVDPFVHSLYKDLNNGLVLLQLFDRIKPGIVNWDKVNNKESLKKMGGNMKKLENCNYAIDIAHQLKFSLVGVGGKDIFDGSKLTLAVVWQAMRAYTLSVLQKLAKSDKPISDAEIVAWVNSTLEAAGKTSRISGFKDAAITTSMPVFDLVDSIKPGAVTYDDIKHDTDEETMLSNAKYAISMSRKIGARVYALPEDLVEPNPKMCLTVFACLMARAKQTK